MLFTVMAMIRGFHVYRDVWSSVLDKELPYQRETGNISDPFAVGVLHDLMDIVKLFIAT